MRKRIIITNQLGESIEICRDPYVFVSFDTSGNEASIVKTKGYMQDGVSVGNVTMNEMTLPIEFYIKGMSLEEVYKLRQQMNRIINPKLGPFSITVDLPHGTFTNTVSIEALPRYRVEDERYQVVQRGLFHILLTDPYWKNDNDIEVPLISWEPNFSFPFSFAPTVTFGTKGEQQRVVNNGDVDTPVKIDVYGPCTSPIITNLTTIEFIKIERDVPAGQRLEINTAYGQKTVQLIKSDGTIINAYNWISADSKLFSLRRGLNILDYNADIGRDSTTVIVRFREQYISL